MQKVILMGNLGRDPEERFSNTGLKISSFPLAVAASKEITIWYECVMFGMKGEIFAALFPYMKKGSKVHVTGRLFPPEIYQAKDGSKKVKMKVDVESINFVQSSQKDDSTRTARTETNNLKPHHELEGELPF